MLKRIKQWWNGIKVPEICLEEGSKEPSFLDRILFASLFVIAVYAMLVLLCSCKTTTKVVEVEKVTHDTLYKYKSIVDTTYVKDSIYLAMLNDTIVLKEYHTTFKYLNKTDTVYKTRVDSIPHVVTVEVEKQLSRWEKFKSKFFGLVSGLLFAIVALLAFGVWRKMKNNV